MNHTLVLTAIIPSLLMALSANFMSLGGYFKIILESFTTGLLIISGVLLIPDITKNNNTKVMGLFGFITSLFFINVISLKWRDNSIIPPLYFDSLSDGLLLGSMLYSLGSFKHVLPFLITMSFEMVISAATSVSILGETNHSKSKMMVTFGAIILGISIVLGNYIGKYINKNFIIGFGSASMLWLGLSEFMPKIIKGVDSDNEENITKLALFSGLLMGIVFE